MLTDRTRKQISQATKKAQLLKIMMTLTSRKERNPGIFLLRKTHKIILSLPMKLYTSTWEHEFELVRKMTFKKKSDNAINSCLYKCDKWGKTLKNTRKLAPTQRRRLKRSSKCTGCSMSLHLSAVDPKDTEDKCGRSFINGMARIYIIIIGQHILRQE